MDLLPDEIQLHIYNYLDELHQYNFAICSRSRVFLSKGLILKDLIQYSSNLKQVKEYIDTKVWNNRRALQYSAKYGRLEILVYLVKELHITPSPEIINIAAEAGYIKVVSYLIETGTVPDSHLVRRCITGCYRTNQKDTIDALEMAKYCIQYSDIDKLVYSHEQHFIPMSTDQNISVERIAASYGRVDILNWLYYDNNRFYHWYFDLLSIKAIENNHFNVIEYVIELQEKRNSVSKRYKAHYLPKNSLFVAIKYDRLEMVKWIVNNTDQKFFDEEIARTITTGKIEILEYLLEVNTTVLDNKKRNTKTQ